MSTQRPQEPNDVVAWLIEGALSAEQPQDVLAQMCDRLLACGLPLHRVAVFVQTLHPDVMGRRFVWRPGEPVDVSDGLHSLLATDTYRLSPFPDIHRTRQAIRRKIEDPNCPQDYNIIEELRAEGITDYLMQPLPFTTGDIHAVSWTTIRPGGFSEADLETLESVRLPLARVAEIYALRRTATNLLNTYVGHHAGERILRGQIQRGDIERIEAVIMLTDLRGFTTLSDRLPGDKVLGLLNSYFDGLLPPIVEHGGEVLEFTGDGLLAIFAVTDRSAAEACREALAAATRVRANLVSANAEREPNLRLRHG
ncbi:MAG: adenylate/guanylate cyclase domain-containing protein, partial [Pseudomonadota bacterium]